MEPRAASCSATRPHEGAHDIGRAGRLATQDRARSRVRGEAERHPEVGLFERFWCRVETDHLQLPRGATLALTHDFDAAMVRTTPRAAPPPEEGVSRTS
ncbi:MAG TPA: hypothetical protein VF395_09320 [Polyangiaceae bacterium]